jgi:hypothetical protein
MVTGALLGCALATISQGARAEVPACEGTDVATQGRARAEGLRRYRAATARSDINRVEMAAALEAFEAQCRAGDVSGLEMRAYALAALGRYVDAAESLDRFLEARPLQTLDAYVRARVGSQRGAILAEVATLSVQGTAQDASVVVNGRPYGALPRAVIRVAPGEVTLQVFSPGLGAWRRTFTMGPGETRTETVDTPASGAIGTPAAEARVGRSSTQTTAVTSGSESILRANPTDERPAPVAPGPRARPAPALAIGLGVGALAMAGAAVGATLWLAGREAELQKPECNAPSDPELIQLCSAVVGERNLARTMQISTGVLAGGLAIGAGVALGLWFSSPPRRATSALRPACAPNVGVQGASLSCAVRF